MNVIDIEGLGKVYRGKKGMRVEALSDLTLSVPEGEVFGFLGPNGAGKSTTLKILTGLIRPTSGRARICGQDVSSASSRRGVGFLPENPAFYDSLTAEEYLRFVGNAFAMSSSEISSKSVEVLELLGLTDAGRRQIRSYSKGMVQRLGIAQTLLHDPDLYILDEPMSGLDPIGRALIKEIIVSLKQRGRTVFFSTHITSDVEAVCDRVGVINKGVLLAVESVQTVLERGITGYDVTFVRTGGVTEELVIEKGELQQFLERAVTSGLAIQRIEPRRKDMEAFFLETVAQR